MAGMARHEALAALAELTAPAALTAEALDAFVQRRATLLAIVTQDARPLASDERAWAAAAATAGAAVVEGAQGLAREMLREMGRVRHAAHTVRSQTGASTLHRFG